MPTTLRSRHKDSKLFGHITCIMVAIVIGLPLWVFFHFLPDAFPFVVAWFIARPIWKIWRTLDGL